jgi:hypothetical protein
MLTERSSNSGVTQVSAWLFILVVISSTICADFKLILFCNQTGQNAEAGLRGDGTTGQVGLTVDANWT